ncbi:MAG: hypothetical protein LBC68_09565 [Prevotellaceae bacterium]|nr:hypothetical protein [Prevotellaceae bacterium]
MNNKSPAVFVNNKLWKSDLYSINPYQIDEINVIKIDTIINGTEYYGLIYILTKDDFIFPQSGDKVYTVTVMKVEEFVCPEKDDKCCKKEGEGEKVEEQPQEQVTE